MLKSQHQGQVGTRQSLPPKWRGSYWCSFPFAMAGAWCARCVDQTPHQPINEHTSTATRWVFFPQQPKRRTQREREREAFISLLILSPLRRRLQLNDTQREKEREVCSIRVPHSPMSVSNSRVSVALFVSSIFFTYFPGKFNFLLKLVFFINL